MGTSNAKSNLLAAAAMTIGRERAEILCQQVEDEAIKAFRMTPVIIELTLAANNAATVMKNMRGGSFRFATSRIRDALKDFDSLP